MEGIIIVGIICAIICSLMAENRNRNTAVWALLGFLFGIFAILAIAIMGKYTEN